jgi:hypothetical protein
MESVLENARKLEIIGEYDVVIAGGGPGGVPAALAASRNGVKTLIIERYGFLGGLSTAGLVGPLFGYAEMINPFLQYTEKPNIGGNSGPLVLGGIPLEIVRKLQAWGAAPEDKDIQWEAVRFDPEMMKHVLDSMLIEAEVDILFHTYVVDVIAENNHIDYLVVESKSGRQAIKASVFVDATGDADIAYFAKAEFTKGRKADGATQPMGTKVIIGGVEEVSEEESNKGFKLVNCAINDKKIHIFHAFWKEISEQGVTLRKGELTPTATRVAGDGTNVRDLTRAELKARKDILEALRFYKENVSGYRKAYLIATPTQIGVRETRQIVGLKRLTSQDILCGRKGLKDAVARGCWWLDIHCPLGLVSSKTWICNKVCNVEPKCIMKLRYFDQVLDKVLPPKPIDYYEIPYGCLVPKLVNNLLVSGRCISADHHAMSSARVIGTCFAIGEAAGTAAALCCQEKVNPCDLNISLLRDKLKEKDVFL